MGEDGFSSVSRSRPDAAMLRLVLRLMLRDIILKADISNNSLQLPEGLCVCVN